MSTNRYNFSISRGRFVQAPKSGAYMTSRIHVDEYCDADRDLRYYMVREIVDHHTMREVRIDAAGYYDLRSGCDARARALGAEWVREAAADTAARRAAGEFLISIN